MSLDFSEFLKKYKWIVKICLSSLLLSYVLRQTNFRAIMSAVTRTSNAWLGVTMGLVFFYILLASYRWQLLLESQEIKVPIRPLFLSYFVGLFFNAFLPTTIGGDLARSNYITPLTKSSVTSVSIIIIERVIGVISQIIVAVIALCFVGSQLSNQGDIWQIILSIIVVFMIVVTCVFFRESFFLLFERFIPVAPIRRKIKRALVSLDKVVVLLKKRKKLVVYSFIISFSIQVIRILFHITMIIALRINIDLELLFIFVPITLIVIMVPIAINGIGISENMYVYFFGFLGVKMGDAIAFSWLVLCFASLIPSLCGGLVLAFHSKALNDKSVLE